MKRQQFLHVLLLTAMQFCFVLIAQAEVYDLRAVKGIEAFGGSAGAKEILSKNGFVVADPGFKQIFEAYIKSPQIEGPSETNPMGRSLPAFITTDSSWHTYHVLLEEGVKQMEEFQSGRLLEFSRKLLDAAKQQKDSDELELFASVGMALQDEKYRQSLTGDQKQIVDGLRSGAEQVQMSIGFPLSPLQFRAQSFYTQSPELSDYFAARQWYASVVFRLSNARETRLAVSLATLVENRPELLTLWNQLSDPLDTLLALAEDGTIREYSGVAKAVLGANVTSATDSQIAEIQKRLGNQLTSPQVNDQQLQPEQYTQFGKETKGFRLLPPRRLPCAVCFHNTTDPKIPSRMYPSGLDFLAASPVLRSPAAVRAVRSQFGKNVSDLVLKADCGSMPDSLHGQAMQLLATLQKPLPAQAPAPLRTEAWSDLQLWSQLGAWAEQRHTWALHTKLSVSYMGIITPPTGMVAPYPEFFCGLAQLTRRTATAFDKTGLEQRFEVKAVASELLHLLTLSQELASARDEKELEKLSGKLEQLGEFQNRYYEKHRTELEKPGSRDAYKKLQSDLEELARRCAEAGQANESEIETLRMFFDSRQSIARLLNDFAPVCDRLANLAKKSLNCEPLTDDDGKWIENYGVTLAGFHFYYGNSYEVPRDDFPIVTRVFSNPLTGSMLYAGLARPQALYIIIPEGKALKLYRGAVMSYREFVRPNDKLLDDDSWRELISKGQTPPAPPFTRSFYAETTVAELLKKLRAQSQSEEGGYSETEEILWQLGSRATEKDLPELFDIMVHTKGDDGRWDVVDGLAEIIGRLPWQSRQKELIELLGSPDNMLAKAAARILIEHAEGVDSTVLITNFTRQPSSKRRMICAILSQLPQASDITRKTLQTALSDQVAGVRWQAAWAVGKSGWNDAQSCSALERTLNDTNQFVGAAAAYSLARLGATNSAPVLFAALKTALSNSVPVEKLEQQSLEITQDMRGDENNALSVLDPDRLETRMYVDAHVNANIKRRAAMRLPPMPSALPLSGYDLATGLIEAIGNLNYTPATDELFKLRGTEYEAVAITALGKLAPDRLLGDLMTTIKDKETDSYLREKAMVTLCSLSTTNHLRDLVPLLDDTTVIVYERTLPGPEWRICDRAALTISMLLGWESRLTPMYMPPDRREQLMTRVRDWANQNR